MAIGDRIKGADNGGGFDHNYVLRSPTNADGLRPAARVFDPESGRSMTVHTDQKGEERSHVLTHTTETYLDLLPQVSSSTAAIS